MPLALLRTAAHRAACAPRFSRTVAAHAFTAQRRTHAPHTRACLLPLAMRLAARIPRGLRSARLRTTVHTRLRATHTTFCVRIHAPARHTARTAHRHVRAVTPFRIPRTAAILRLYLRVLRCGLVFLPAFATCRLPAFAEKRTVRAYLCHCAAATAHYARLLHGSARLFTVTRYAVRVLHYAGLDAPPLRTGSGSCRLLYIAYTRITPAYTPRFHYCYHLYRTRATGLHPAYTNAGYGVGFLQLRVRCRRARWLRHARTVHAHLFAFLRLHTHFGFTRFWFCIVLVTCDSTHFTLRAHHTAVCRTLYRLAHLHANLLPGCGVYAVHLSHFACR